MLPNFLTLLALAIPLATCQNTLTAFGIAVKDIARSQNFYTTHLGLKSTGQAFNTTEFDEIVLALPPGANGKSSGSALALMQWKTIPNTASPGVKVVFNVPDVKATIEGIRAAGLRIVLEPGKAKVGNVTIPTAMARDPDGYLVEINPKGFLSSPSSKAT